MQKENRPPVIRQTIFFFLTAFLVLTTDQFTKSWLRSHVALGESWPLTGWLKLSHIGNTGSAFGLFQNQSLILTIIAFIGIAFLLVLALYGYRHLPFLGSTWGKVALGLVLGGTVGNVVDRIRLGYVTDFIDFGFWPAFNIADSSIVTGTAIIAVILLSSIFTEKRGVK